MRVVQDQDGAGEEVLSTVRVSEEWYASFRLMLENGADDAACPMCGKNMTSSKATKEQPVVEGRKFNLK